MRFFLTVAMCALLFAAGCAQDKPAPAKPESSAQFVLPSQETAYFARYNVEEGATMKKEVWRSGESMRADLSVQGVNVLSFYFVNRSAYSCSYLSNPPSCYNVTATLSQADARKLLPLEEDFKGAMRVESVKIGETEGKCYEATVVGIGPRKVCFAVGGVMAFDSYNVSRTVLHTEYLTSLEFYPQGKGPDGSVFALPTDAISAPATQAPPVLQEE